MNATQFFGAMFGPLRRLTDFSGRSTRPEFWPFVFLLYAAQQIVTMIAVGPLMSHLQKVGETQQQDQTLDAMNAEVTRVFFDMFNKIVPISIALAALSALLLAAVVTRRLHDTNRTGWWAAPVVVMGGISLWLFSRIVPLIMEMVNAPDAIKNVDAGIAAIAPIFATNLIYLIFVATLIVFCAQDGTPGPNRFGDDPKDRDPAEEAARQAQLMQARHRRRTALREPAQRPPPARVISNDSPEER